jgi:hypothetical protein
MEEVTTPEALPDAPHVSAPDGEGADLSGSIPLDALKDVLGKDFKDVDGALKSIKDTYSYVGSQAKYREEMSRLSAALNTDEAGVLSVIEKLMSEPNNAGGDHSAPSQPVVDNGQYVTKEDMFFMTNKELADMRDILTPIKNASEETRNLPWDQFVNSETAKKVIEPIKGYREMESRKSVLDSSPRLGAAVDKITNAGQLADQARQAALSGDVATASRAQEAARASAVDSVMDAYDLK